VQACDDGSDESSHDTDAIIRRENRLQGKSEKFQGGNLLKGKRKQKLRLKWKVNPDISTS
jgi:hypothetical protein